MQKKFNISVKQLYLLIFITAASLTGLGLYGISGYKKLNENTRTLYADRVVCMHQLANMRFEYATEIVPMALDVKNNILTFDEAVRRIRKALLIIDSDWHNYKLTYLTPEENFLVRQTDTLKDSADEETEVLQSILVKRDTAALDDLIKKQMPAQQMAFLLKLTQLMDLQERVGKQIFEDSRHTYTAASKNFAVWIFFSLLIAVSLSFLIIKNIRRLIKDILESNESVKISENKYRSILENASDAIYLVDNERRFVEANDSMCKMLGYLKSELLQLKIEDVFDNEQLKTDPVDLSLIPYHSTFKQRRFITKGGMAIEVEIHGRRLDENKWMGVARDITERKRMETELRDAEMKFRTLAEKSIVGVYISEGERLAYINPRFAEIFGYEPQELIDMPDGVINTLFSKDGQEIIRANLQARYNRKVENAHYEVTGIRKDGTTNYIELYGSIVTIGGRQAIIGTLLDITERKQAEELILKEKELSNTIINSLPGIFYLRDEHGRSLRWNKNLEVTTGYTTEEIEGKVLRDLVADEDRETIRRVVETTLKGGYSTAEVKLATKDGRKIPYLLSKKTVNYENQLCLLGIGTDISQRVKAEEELKISEKNFAEYNRELNLLNSINDVILRNGDELELYREICNCIVWTGGYKLAWVCHKPDENDAGQIVKPLVAAGVMDYLSDVTIDLSDPELSKGPTGTVLRTGKTFVNNDVNNLVFFAPWVERAKKHGIQSSLALYLDFGNGKTGGLMIYSGQTDAFDKHEVYILERLASNVSIAVQGIRTRMELAGSEARFRGAFENASIGVGLVSLKGEWLKVNRALCGMLGYNEDALLNLTFQQLTHPDDMDRDLGFFEQTLEGERDFFQIEKRYFHKDGNILWVNLNVSLIRDQNRQPMYFVSQIENITEKIESQLKFQNLVENFIVGVYILQNGRLVYVNPRALEESGYAEEDMINMPFEHFIYSEDLVLVQKMTKARDKGLTDAVRYEARMIKKDGCPLWCEMFGSSTIYNGAPALIGTLINIDERKEAENEIHRLSRLYHFISRMNESMLKSETAGDIFSEACRIAVEVGKFRMAWVGMYDEKNDRITPVAWDGYDNGFLDLINVPGMKVSESAIPSARAIQQKTDFYYNDIANDPDIPVFIKQEMVKRNYLSGTSFPIFIDGKIVAAMVLLMSEPFFFNEQEIKLLRGVTDNITYALDKIKIREQQNRSDADLRSIFDTTEVNYMLLDTNYDIVAINQQSKDWQMQLTGVVFEKGVNVIKALSPERREHTKALYDRVILTNQPEDYETSYLQDGAYTHFLANVKPIHDGKKAIGVCITGIDITVRKNAVEKLEAANEDLQKKTKELEFSNTELEQFAYVASHDLQEPLRMVTSFLSQLEKKYGNILDEKGKKYIYFATDGAKRMRQLILDLLEFSRVGRMEDSLEEVDFNDLMNEVLPLYRKNIEDLKAKVYVEQLPAMQVYKTPVRQVFQNLLGNALKYHREGIAPLIRIASKETPTAFEFSVKDNGIGIDPEYFNQIFIIFKRLHNRDQYPGTGMGLAITKKIVENMGGTIWVDSREGEGSVFHFTIPKHTKI